MKLARPLAAAVGLTSMLLAGSATAQEDDGAVTAKPISASLLLGVGTGGLGFGLGARVGYTLPMRVYLGGTFVYHFVSASSAYGVSSSSSFFYPGVEGGYEIPAGPVWVRPYLGLGVGISNSSASSSVLGTPVSYSNSNSDFAAWFGGVVTYNVTSQFFVGGDARVLLVSGYNSFNVFANGGVRF